MTQYAACPRCGGSLYQERDYAGLYESCLNCGFLRALDRYDPEGKRDLRQGGKGPRRGKLRGMTRAQRSRG